jgi:hypothetical protein
MKADIVLSGFTADAPRCPTNFIFVPRLRAARLEEVARSPNATGSREPGYRRTLTSFREDVD